MRLLFERLTRDYLKDWRGDGDAGMFGQMLADYFGEIAPNLVPQAGQAACGIIADADIPGRYVEVVHTPSERGTIDAVGFIYGSSDLPKRDGYGLIADDFWRKLGYAPNGELAEWNGDPIYEKRIA